MASIYKIASGWRAQIRLQDKPSISKVFESKRDAQVWVREQEHQLHKTSFKNPDMTFGDLLTVYKSKTRKPAKTKDAVLKYLDGYFSTYRLYDFKHSTFADYAERRRRDVGPATVLQELTYLGVVLKHGGAFAESPEAMRAKDVLSSAIVSLRHSGHVRESVQRDRRPTEDELARLEEHFLWRPRSNTPMFDIVLFAICTCMRLGEIVGSGGILVEDLDLEKRLVRIRQRKDPTNPDRCDTIPLLCGPVLYKKLTIDPVQIVQRQRTIMRPGRRIFPYAESTIDAAFIDAVKKCQIDDLHFHDLRHDGISRLFESGYQIPEVASVSGHKSWKHLQRYTQIRPESLHRTTEV